MHYTSPRHARLFRNVARAKSHTPHTLAAIYLLTAKKKLWKKWQRAVTNQGINWGGNRRIDSSWEGYYLECAARSIGITYKVWDRNLNAALAVKEYYPSGLVNRVPGTRRTSSWNTSTALH